MTKDRLIDSTDEDVDKLSLLCGYLPLALRVAASLLKDRRDWMLGNLLNRLADEKTRLQKLKREGDKFLDVEASLSLSYQLLTPETQKHFRKLGIFAEPFLKHYAAVIWGISEDDADDVIGSLENRSLIIPIPVSNHDEIKEAQYLLHDLTRLFAISQLSSQPDDAVESLERYALFFLQGAEFTEDGWHEGGENKIISIHMFRSIWPHLRTIWHYMLPNEKPYLPRVAMADEWLSNFPQSCPYALSSSLSPQECIPILESALEAARRTGNERFEAHYTNNLGNTYISMGYVDKATDFF